MIIINIQPFIKENSKYIKQAEELLIQAFPHSYSECAVEEIEKCLKKDRVALMAIEDDNLVGFIGAIPQYGVTGWELHPLVVEKNSQHKGIGSLLINALEKEIKKRGGVTIYLGSDDEFCKTSLGNIDLYDKLFEKIDNIKNNNYHPFEFYQKVGYKIVGVIPDANGIGKPDIWMAKRIV